MASALPELQERDARAGRESDTAAAVPRARSVTTRAVVLGLVGVVLVCAFTPFNDYALGNTPLVGNYLPVGLVLYLLAVILPINGVLSRWRPRAAMRGGE